MKIKVIYIAGLYHTGSTLLDMILGSLPNVIGLGEVFKGLHDKFEDHCTCGQRVEDCDFWGRVLKKIKAEHDLDINSKYRLVLSTFSEQYGDEKILVDSSICHPFKLFSATDERDMQGLNQLIKIEDIELKVIHLVRDVRSWTNSLLTRDERDKDELKYFKRLFMFIFRSPSARFIQWYWGHTKIIQFLEKNNLEHIRISYEDLAIQPEKTLRQLSCFLGITYQDSMLNPNNSKSHIAVGNPVRFKDKAMKKINYDYRWFGSSRLSIPALILRPIMKFNKKIMYDK